jgi:hypothetical protein
MFTNYSLQQRQYVNTKFLTQTYTVCLVCVCSFIEEIKRNFCVRNLENMWAFLQYYI